MNIITGFCAPSSGNVIIEGRKIVSRRDVLNSSLGLCPQHNVLFDNLTVREHLYFYATLKSDPQRCENVSHLMTVLVFLCYIF